MKFTINSIAAQLINTPAIGKYTLKKAVLLGFTVLSSLCTLSTVAQAQYNPNIYAPPSYGATDSQTNNAALIAATNAAAFNATPYNPAPYNPVAATGSGYTNDGTLMMGGNKIGNPHQILHDLNVPSFFAVNANRLSYSDNPAYGQGTLAQMENHTLTIGVPAGNVVLSRLYLTPDNPYTPGVGAYPNYQTYQDAVAAAQAGSYQVTVANDTKLYAFKTLGTMSTQSQNILIKELPAHSAFIANSDPKGGAVAVRVMQNGDYAAMQNYFDTVKPYDFGWRSALAPFGNNPDTAAATGAFFTNWVLGSDQVKSYQANLQNQSSGSGNEAFGVLAWDANLNRYTMLDAANVNATNGSVSGNMPTLGNNQFGFFGVHTHPGSATPSNQDNKMTQKLGLDQLVVGTDGVQAIYANNPNNGWQGQEFLLEAPKTVTLSYGGSIYGGRGGGGQTGMYVTYDTDTKRITDVGYYKAIEAGTGIGIMGVGVQGGGVDGDKDTLSGTSYNTNVSIGKASMTVTTDGKGNVIGVSGGPAATIPGISRTEVNTTATSLVTDGNSTSVDSMGNSTGSPSP